MLFKSRSQARVEQDQIVSKDKHTAEAVVVLLSLLGILFLVLLVGDWQ